MTDFHEMTVSEFLAKLLAAIEPKKSNSEIVNNTQTVHLLNGIEIERMWKYVKKRRKEAGDKPNANYEITITVTGIGNAIDIEEEDVTDYDAW